MHDPTELHHITSSSSACARMWGTFGRALIAIITMKENMLLARFKEKEFNARLRVEQKKKKIQQAKGLLPALVLY